MKPTNLTWEDIVIENSDASIISVSDVVVAEHILDLLF